jgi:hypothetical protein
MEATLTVDLGDHPLADAIATSLLDRARAAVAAATAQPATPADTNPVAEPVEQNRPVAAPGFSQAWADREFEVEHDARDELQRWIDGIVSNTGTDLSVTVSGADAQAVADTLAGRPHVTLAVETETPSPVV